MTERMASGWMTVWSAGYRGAKDSERRSHMREATYNLKDITKERRAIEALKEAYEELKETVRAKRISFPQ